MKKGKEKFFIAQIGKTHGLRGDLKLHLHTDFPEQFKVGYDFDSSIGRLEVSRVNLKKGTIAFRGYDRDIDSAKPLTNVKIYSNPEETRERCFLKDGEHFWFDLEGCEVIEDNEPLGVVEKMDRFGDVNYMLVKTDEALVKKGFASNFLIPYIKRYVIDTDIDSKKIYVQDAKDILEAS